MLGVDDEYNMCLFDIETVENICLIMLRYVFIPIVQLETPKFQKMTKALIEGLSPLMPHMSYENQMFMVKRIIGVPGYQYNVDLSKEKIIGNVFTKAELTASKELLKMMFNDKQELLKAYDILFDDDDGIPIVTTKAHSVLIDITEGKDSVNKNDSVSDECVEIGDRKFYWIMRSKGVDDWKIHLHDTEFSKLSIWDQITVRWLCFVCKINRYTVGRYLSEVGLNALLFFIRRQYKRNNVRKNG